MPNTQTEFLSVDQTASELHITPRAVRHRITAGTLAAMKVGAGRTSAYVITRTEVERIKQEQETARAERAAAAS